MKIKRFSSIKNSLRNSLTNHRTFIDRHPQKFCLKKKLHLHNEFQVQDSPSSFFSPHLFFFLYSLSQLLQSILYSLQAHLTPSCMGVFATWWQSREKGQVTVTFWCSNSNESLQKAETFCPVGDGILIALSCSSSPSLRPVGPLTRSFSCLYSIHVWFQE